MIVRYTKPQASLRRLSDQIRSTLGAFLDAVRIDERTTIYRYEFFSWVYDHYVARAELATQVLFVSLLDLNHLKQFNTDYGDQAGNAILRQVGNVLHDYTARIELLDAIHRSGDEFFLIGIAPDREAAAAVVRGALNEVKRASVRIVDRRAGAPAGAFVELRVSAVAGVALLGAGEGEETIRRHAEEACKAAKVLRDKDPERRGKVFCHVYDGTPSGYDERARLGQMECPLGCGIEFSVQVPNATAASHTAHLPPDATPEDKIDYLRRQLSWTCPGQAIAHGQAAETPPLESGPVAAPTA